MATKKTASKNNEQVISIAPIDIRKVNIRIRGTAPIIMHKWSEKAKKMILDKQTGETQTEAREKKNPVQDFISSAYWLTEEPKDGTEEAFEAAVANGARWGFPVTAIKQAAIVSASRTGLDIKGTVLRASFFIEGDRKPPHCCSGRGGGSNERAGRAWMLKCRNVGRCQPPGGRAPSS